MFQTSQTKEPYICKESQVYIEPATEAMREFDEGTHTHSLSVSLSHTHTHTYTYTHTRAHTHTHIAARKLDKGAYVERDIQKNHA